jgi:hypothetical protein
MASYFTGHQPGGGLKSRNVVETPVRTGTGSRSARPAGVSQFGYSVADHVTNQLGSTNYKGEPLHGPSDRNFQPTKFGNEIALNVKGGGPGTGRTIYKTGTQQQYGSGGPEKPQGREILGAYGPESKR